VKPASIDALHPLTWTTLCVSGRYTPVSAIAEVVGSVSDNPSATVCFERIAVQKFGLPDPLLVFMLQIQNV
jgi:hypothetical protein